MNRDELTFSQIVREHKSTIYTVCYMFSQNADEVNDLFQETLVNLWNGMTGFNGDSKMNTWIYRVALNTCISMDRKKKRRGKAISLSMSANLYEDTDNDSRQVQMLHQRIGRLGLVDRAIVLMWLENMSYDEIGAIVGITPQHVGVKLHRIKEELKKMK